MRNVIWFLLILFGFSSCSAIVTWFRPKGFTYRYDGKYTGLDTLLDIDGYFYNDSTLDAVMLYRDGSIAKVEELYNEQNFLQENKNKFYYSPRWGTYRIIGDTIRTQIILNFGGMENMRTGLNYYLIKSKDEIVYKIDGYYVNDSISPWEKRFVDDTLKISLYFHPYPNRMDSAHWVKKRKWFWDKEAYKKRKDKKQ